MPQPGHSQPQRVTIRDVAEAAGVSTTTVSNVLNGRTHTMSEATWLRVQETIRSLSYHPSSVARSMVTRSTATIGIIIAEIETPLFLQALNFIEPVVRSAGYNLLMCNARYPKDEQQAVDLLLEKRVDGIIFLSTSQYLDDEYLLRLPPSAPPMVLINRTRLYDQFDHVNWDNVTAMVALVEYLIQLGHRQIAHLRGPLNRRAAEERLQGYRMALARHGFKCREDYTQLASFSTGPEVEEATLRLLETTPPPTAIVAANDSVAAVAQRTAQRAGLRIPDDITIVGVDDQPFCVCLNPALTTIRIPLVEAGERAIHMLLDRIAHKRTAVEHILLPCPLIVRESSGVAPGKSV
jgi:DNA-binding LacI/PurR family transcriptional regulator